MSKASRAGIFAVIAGAGLSAPSPVQPQGIGDVLKDAAREAIAANLPVDLNAPHAHEIKEGASTTLVFHDRRVANEPDKGISYEAVAQRHFDNAYRPTLTFQRGSGNQQARVQIHDHGIPGQNFVLRHSHNGGNLAHSEEGMNSSGAAITQSQRGMVTLTDDMHCHRSLADSNISACHIHYHADVKHIHPDSAAPEWGPGISLDEHFRQTVRYTPAQILQQQSRPATPQRLPGQNPAAAACKDMPTLARIACEAALNRN